MSAVNWNHPLNEGLSSWHLVGDGTVSGPTWYDLCGNYHGTLTNANINTCWYGSTRTGQWGALKHNGGTDTVALAAGGGLNSIQTGTVSLWVMWLAGTQETYVSLSGTAFGRSDNATFTNQCVGLNGTNPDTAKIIWNPYASNVSACTSTQSPGVNVWHHVIVTYKTGDHRLYIDGVFDVVGTTAGTMTDSAGTALSLGSVNSSNLIGLIDCVRIFPNRIFTETDAAVEYAMTSDYCRELLMRKRRFVSPGSSFKPAWAARCNKYMTAGNL